MAKPKKKSQGFGHSQVRTRGAKDFIVAFGKKEGDEQEVFLTANLDKLDESLLEALPLVFQAMTKSKSISTREAIAAIFGTFGNLLGEFPRGIRWLNLELSIVAYSLALTVFTQKDSPENWATTQMNLGNAYSYRIRGDKAENVEMAIAAYKRALEIRTREDLPQEWASVQMNLGGAYCNRIRGDKAENLEMAIAVYKRALEIRTREDFSQEWATTQMNLGIAYRNRIRGDKAENVEMAIAAYKRALEIRTCENLPQDWADVQMNLGLAYSYRIRGNKAENVEMAIATYKRALEIFTREDLPQDWASTQMNLGLAYSDRIRGDKTENIEQAIHSFKLSLEIFTQESFPENWAKNQHNLADAYLKRVQGNTKENIEEAISLYNEAAEVFTHKAYPHKWFRNHSHLGVAYLERANLHLTETDIEIDRLTDLNVSITLLQEALATADPNAPTPDYIDAQFQLGTALQHRHDLTKDTADLQQALNAYKIAYDAISPEHYDREKMWQALPETQTILGSRLVRDGEWHQGLELLNVAIAQLSPRSSTNPRAYAYALYQVGRTHEIMSNWKDARIYYYDALRFYEHIDDKAGMAWCHHGLGAILGCQSALTKSLAELNKARALYQQQGMHDKMEEVDELISLAQEGQQINTALNLRISA